MRFRCGKCDQIRESIESKHIQRKREWNQEREMLLMRCKATENSQQVLRNVRGILEQLRAELKREENRRNELEREFLQQKILWDRERKELHEEIYELQRTEQMWLNHDDASDSRVTVLHKKVQELRNEKLNILKMAEIEKMNWEEQKQQLLLQLRQSIQFGGGAPQQMNGQVGNELNDRLDSALQQIETVSRQLCSVQDNNKIGFQNGTAIGQQSRQMSASTSCIPDSNQPRPKSSFDVVRHAREKGQRPPSREIFSDTQDLTTDDENRALPGLHKNTTIKSKQKSGLQSANLQGPIPWGQMSNGNGNGQIGNGNRTAAGFSPTHSQPARPNSAQGKSPNPYIQSPMMASAQSIQQNNLENLQRQQQEERKRKELEVQQQQQLARQKEQQRLLKQQQNLAAFQQQMNAGRVRFQNNVSNATSNDTKKIQFDNQEGRGFDSDDGAAKARRESRLRRMRQMEARRNVLCGETTDDNEERNEQVRSNRRSKKYTRSKTDTSAAEMRQAMVKQPMSKLTTIQDRSGKPKVLEQFERKLLANENRQPSTERNGVIERRLTGNQNGSEKPNEEKSKIQKETNKESTVDEKPLDRKASADAINNQINQNQARNDAMNTKTPQLSNKSSRTGNTSNLARGRGLSGSTPNLSQSQLSEKYQRGFTTTAAERAEQLRKAREQIEAEKIKRTESLKQRISMFEAARARANQQPERTEPQTGSVTNSSRSGASVSRSQSLKMAPTFGRTTINNDTKKSPKTDSKGQSGQLSEALAERRSMVAGILNAGPPKKKASKYERSNTQPVGPADRIDQPTVTVPERPSGPANRRLPSRWRSGDRNRSITSAYDLDLSVD